MNQKNVLVLTVGTGNIEKIEESLLRPLRKSVQQGTWSKVILLPSTVTENFAEQLTKQFPSLPIRVACLPKSGMENDADKCFGYFDKILEELLAEGYANGNITVDFTRGTKAMSAALVLAAVRQDIPSLRYIHGQRDNHGTVIPGTENIYSLSTTLATARRQLDTAINLMRSGNFAAVLELIPEEPNQFTEKFPKEFREQAGALRRKAYFYAAWDRLDYKEAKNRAENVLSKDGRISNQAAWICDLANEPDRDKYITMAQWLQNVSCDLLENGRRRISDRHFEDALLRGYRVLELIGQFLLFEREMDSANIDPDIPAVQKLKAKLTKSGSHGFGQDKNGRLQAPRKLVARLLKELGVPLAKNLLSFDQKNIGVKAGQRNHSILIHGFATTSGSDDDALHGLYDDLEKILQQACPEAMKRAKNATDPFPRI